jgi:hypothetical protein
VIIGVTDEEPEVVEAWLARAKPKYPIARTKGEFEDQIDVPHFPYSAVIGPDGNITYAGDAGGGESKIDEGLKGSKKEALWPKSLAKVTKLMQGDPVKAYGELKKLQSDPKLAASDKPFVDSFVAYLEEQAKQAQATGKSLFEQGYVLKAVRTIESYSAAVPAFPSSADSQTLLKEMQALPDYKKEVTGGEAYLAAEALEKDYEFLEAFEGYKSVSKKFEGTKIAGVARTDAERLMKDGLPGMVPACPNCSKVRRACVKHKKEVKL